MAFQITSEGGANLAPAAPSALTNESAGNLAPSSPGHVAPEGGGDLGPDAPADLVTRLSFVDAILIEGNATIEVTDGITTTVLPIAGYYFKTLGGFGGKDSWSRSGIAPFAPTGIDLALVFDPTAWSVYGVAGNTAFTGWMDGDSLNVASPLDVEDWVAGGAVTTGTFTMTAVTGIAPPNAIASEGGVNLVPAAPPVITPESSY